MRVPFDPGGIPCLFGDRMRNILLGFAFLLACPILLAQQTLDNDAIIKLAKAGRSDEQIITTIKASPGNYDISMYALDVLRTAGISEKVLEAIVRKTSGVGPNVFPGTRRPPVEVTPAAATVAPPTAATPSPDTEPPADKDTGEEVAVAPDRAVVPTVARAHASEPAPAPITGPNGLPVGIDGAGVYLRDRSGAWVAMTPETVTFQSAVRMQDIATAGILKSDLNGRVEGLHSQVNVTLPLVFAVYLPFDAAITDYFLVELHPASRARTFLSAEGGLLRTKPGAHQDQIDFQPEKLAPRLYLITLPAIEGKGEYGLLAPGARITSNKQASGKIYTVTATE